MERPLNQTVAIDTVPLPTRTIRVSLPTSVAYDLKRFQKIQATVLDRLGCTACCSGWDIQYDVVRSFAFDEKLNLK